MKRQIARILLLIFVPVISVHAQAIFEGNDGPIDPVVVLLHIYKNFSHFTAKATIVLDEELPLNFHYSVSDGAIASRFELTELASECPDVFEQMGIGETKSIFSIHEKKCIVIYPGKMGYYTLTLSGNDPHLSVSKVEKEILNYEKINGQDCQHCRYTLLKPDGTKMVVDSWEAKIKNGFPMRLTYTTEYFYALRMQKITVTATFDKVEFNRPDITVFEVPENYKQFPNRQTLMDAPVPDRSNK